MLIIIKKIWPPSARESVSIVPRPLPEVMWQAWFASFTTLGRSRSLSTGLWGQD